MSVASPNLWNLVDGRPQIDPTALAAAVERQADEAPLDYRTRLLIRDSMDALCRRWGAQRMQQWLNGSSRGTALQEIWRADLGPPGFPSLSKRLMDATQPQTVEQFLRELGAHLPQLTRIDVGGSIALILTGHLSRHTEDIDVVDEVPSEIRSQHELLDQLSSNYGLQITHFQSHYLPSGWQSRLRSLGRFGQLDVFLVDPYDIFVGKLFSARAKDLGDLRMLLPRMDKDRIVSRLRDATALRNEKPLAEHASRNWYILFGETLKDVC